MTGDLADTWGEYGGLVGRRNRMADVLDMSIADHPGVAATFGRQIRAPIQKTDPKPSPITDYRDLMGDANSDVNGGGGARLRNQGGTGEKG